MLSSCGLEINENKCPYEGAIVPMALCGTESLNMKSAKEKEREYY